MRTVRLCSVAAFVLQDVERWIYLPEASERVQTVEKPPDSCHGHKPPRHARNGKTHPRLESGFNIAGNEEYNASASSHLGRHVDVQDDQIRREQHAMVEASGPVPTSPHTRPACLGFQQTSASCPECGSSKPRRHSARQGRSEAFCLQATHSLVYDQLARC